MLALSSPKEAIWPASTSEEDGALGDGRGAGRPRREGGG